MACKSCGADIDEHEELCPACKEAQQREAEAADARRMFEQIRTLRIIGQDDEALALCEQLTQAQPENLEACVLMGDLLMERKHHDQAVMWFQRALKLSPDDTHIQPKLDHALDLAMGVHAHGPDDLALVDAMRERSARSRGGVTLLLVLLCLAVIAACASYLTSTLRRDMAARHAHPAPTPAVATAAPVKSRAEAAEMPADTQPAEAAQPVAPAPTPAATAPAHPADDTAAPSTPAPVVVPASLKQETTTTPVEFVKVARVTGLTVQEARLKLQSSGLGVIVTPVTSSTAKPDRVIRSQPAAGAKVSADANVTLFVAQLPMLKNYQTWQGDDAAADLKSQGLRPVIVQRVTDKAVPGLVLSTDPAPGAGLKPGQAVSLYVARAPGREHGWKLPTLRDMTQEEAEALLTAKGYHVQIVLTDDDLIESGRVTGTSPLAGTPLQKGDSVTVYVVK